MSAPDWLPRAVELAKASKTYEQIGIELGLSRNTVCKAMVRHKANIEVQAHKRDEQDTPPWAEKARAMREAGASWKTIMREFGLSFRTLAKAIDPNYSERRAKENQRFMEAATGMLKTGRQIAQMRGILLPRLGKMTGMI